MIADGDGELLDLRVGWQNEFWIKRNRDGIRQMYCRYCLSLPGVSPDCWALMQPDRGEMKQYRRTMTLRNHAATGMHRNAMLDTPEGRVGVEVQPELYEVISSWDRERRTRGEELKPRAGMWQKEFVGWHVESEGKIDVYCRYCECYERDMKRVTSFHCAKEGEELVADIRRALSAMRVYAVTSNFRKVLQASCSP